MGDRVRRGQEENMLEVREGCKDWIQGNEKSRSFNHVTVNKTKLKLQTISVVTVEKKICNTLFIHKRRARSKVYLSSNNLFLFGHQLAWCFSAFYQQDGIYQPRECETDAGTWILNRLSDFLSRFHGVTLLTTRMQEWKSQAMWGSLVIKVLPHLMQLPREVW